MKKFLVVFIALFMVSQVGMAAEKKPKAEPPAEQAQQAKPPKQKSAKKHKKPAAKPAQTNQVPKPVQKPQTATAKPSLPSTGSANKPKASGEEWKEDHPRRAEVNSRLSEQEKRIEEGLKSGKLTQAEAQQLREKDANIRQQERAEAAANGGFITKAEQKQLNQEENAASKQIYDEKHPGVNGGTPTLPNKTSQASTPTGSPSTATPSQGSALNQSKTSTITKNEEERKNVTVNKNTTINNDNRRGGPWWGRRDGPYLSGPVAVPTPVLVPSGGGSTTSNVVVKTPAPSVTNVVPPSSAANAAESPKVIVTWKHSLNNVPNRRISFYSNGKIDDPTSSATWVKDGDHLIMSWPDKHQPGGKWIIHCTLSADGNSYSGTNQKGGRVSGVLESAPE